MENSKQLLLLKKKCIKKLSKHFPDDFMVSVTSYKLHVMLTECSL